MENNVTVSGTTTLKVGRFRRIHRILRTGNNIHLKPGFTAPSGIDFTAKIGTVTNVAKRFYYLKDHLGSVRVTVDEAGEIVSSDDYDPWGMIIAGRSSNSGFTNDKYKFTGKERDVETGYDYFACPPKSEGRRRGARYYDSRIGRWLQVDPLTEKYFGWSPYNYTLNNPLKLIDPDGRQVFFGSSALYARPQIYFRGNWRLFPNQRYQDVLKPKVSQQRYQEPIQIFKKPIKLEPTFWKYLTDFIFHFFGPKAPSAVVPPIIEPENTNDEKKSSDQNNNNEEDNSKEENNEKDRQDENKKEED